MFELRFYMKNDRSYDYQSVDQSLLNINHVKKLENVGRSAEFDVTKFEYLNDRTRVQACFSNCQRENDANSRVETDNFMIFPGFTETPLRFTLDIKKPSFFALELMPIVSKLCIEFKFYIFDLQNKDSKEPTILKSSQLIESWNKSNEKCREIEPVSKKSKFDYLKPEIADDWWEYMFNLDKFQKIASETFFIPEMLLLQHKKNNEIFRTVTWADFMPIALPTCEKVAIIQTQGVYKVKIKNLGIFDYQELLTAFEPYFSDLEIYNRQFNVLSFENSEKYSGDFAEILKKLKSQESKKFEVLNFENFQN